MGGFLQLVLTLALASVILFSPWLAQKGRELQHLREERRSPPRTLATSSQGRFFPRLGDPPAAQELNAGLNLAAYVTRGGLDLVSDPPVSAARQFAPGGLVLSPRRTWRFLGRTAPPEGEATLVWTRPRYPGDLSPERWSIKESEYWGRTW